MYVDIFVLIVLVWAAYHGWKDGILKQVVSSVGVIVGLVVAAQCYERFSQYLAINGSEVNMLTNIVAFFLLWIIVPIFLGYAAKLLTKTLKAVKLGFINSFCGALISIAKYLLLLSCIFNVMGALHIMDEERTKDSRLFDPVCQVAKFGFHEINERFIQKNTNDADNDTVWIDLQPAEKQN